MMRGLVIVLFMAILTGCGGGADAPSFTSGTGSKKSSAIEVGTVRGEIRGLGGASATVILGNHGELLLTTRTDYQGRFEFQRVPHGAVFVKAEAAGLTVSPPQAIQVGPQTAPLVFSAIQRSNDTFTFYWDNTVGAYETAVNHINNEPSIKYLDEVLPAPDTAAANSLLSTYQIILSDKGVAWNNEYASRLLTILGTLPTRNSGVIHTGAPFRPSKWELTNDYIDGDIRIQRDERGDTVLLSTAVFVYATPKLVTLDGIQGRYFSKRLHHALVRFATQEGKDGSAVDNILYERYGVSTSVDDYSMLTAQTTREGAGSFAPFKPEELVSLINALEEMPEAFHKVRGLRYLVRRAYGGQHPTDKRIIARAHPSAGYIEFGDAALAAPESMLSKGIILHEKAHFLWANVFSQEQRDGWIAVGGWYRDPSSPSKWLTSQSTTFVSAYAHDVSPEEDLAESVAAYIFNPDLLSSRAQNKFNYLKERVFNGERIIAQIREDLTFMVQDANPDYTPPGKIKRLDIQVRGAPEEDKLVTAVIELSSTGDPTPGAWNCTVNLLPPSGNHSRRTAIGFHAWNEAEAKYLYDVNANVLMSRSTISRFAERGYWRLENASCVDIVGNRRYLGPQDLGNASIYINSAQEQVGPPKYEPGSLSLQSKAVRINGHTYHHVTATWRMQPHPLNIRWISTQLMDIDTYGSRIEPKWTNYDVTTRTAVATFVVRDYFASGRYGLTWIRATDEASNSNEHKFPDPGTNEPVRWVDINNPNGDKGLVPELDLNRITVAAAPVRPEAPDGETKVKVAFYARDDTSGFATLYILLRNPQGEIIMSYFHVSPGSPGGLAAGIYAPPGSSRATRAHGSVTKRPSPCRSGRSLVNGVSIACSWKMLPTSASTMSSSS